MAKTLSSFLLGVAISSVWWLTAVWHPTNDDGKPSGYAFLIAGIFTLYFGVLVGMWITDNWDKP